MNGATIGRVLGPPLIITPTYNERDNLVDFVGLLTASVPDAQLLVIDDASPDGTGELADELHRRHPDRIRVMHRTGKLGLGSAYLTGFRYALQTRPDVVVEMDADLSHDPARLGDLLSAIDGGADVAVGSRWVAGGGVEGWGLGRRVMSRGGSLYSRWILSAAVRDMTSGFVAFRTSALERIGIERIRSEGYAFQVEVKYRALRRGLRLIEVPITFVDRRVGRSKMSRRIFFEAVGMIPRLRIDTLLGRL